MTDLNERAAKCLGWERCANGKNTYCYHDENGLLHINEANFTTDISQAWKLVEKCREQQLEVHISCAGSYHCTVAKTDVDNWRDSKLKLGISDDTAAEAITAACVEALEAQDECSKGNCVCRNKIGKKEPIKGDLK